MQMLNLSTRDVNRPAFGSEQKLVELMLQQRGIAFNKPLTIVQESLAVGTSKKPLVNPPFSLFFEADSAAGKKSSTISAAALPMTVGIDLFLVMDKSFEPLWLDFLPMFESLPPQLIEWALAQAHLVVEDTCRDLARSNISPRDLESLFQKGGYRRIMSMADHLLFLLAADVQRTIVDARRTRLLMSDKCGIDLYFRDNRLVGLDGWISGRTPDFGGWKVHPD